MVLFVVLVVLLVGLIFLFGFFVFCFLFFSPCSNCLEAPDTEQVRELGMLIEEYMKVSLLCPHLCRQADRAESILSTTNIKTGAWSLDSPIRSRGSISFTLK